MNKLRDANRAYGEKLAELGAELPELVVLDADLAACSKTAPFIERSPGRHYNVGIQECNMVGVAAGMAACGKIPFVNSFGMFTAGRAYDQIRNAVVYPGLNVKVVGFYSGLSNGEDGPTHQCVEDLAALFATISPVLSNFFIQFLTCFTVNPVSFESVVTVVKICPFSILFPRHFFSS